MSRTLELNCLVLGQDVSRIFTVEISDKKTVSILKKEIKKEKAPAFDHVPADTLVLWKVSILADDNHQQNINALNLVERSEQQLQRPAARLSKVFSDLSDDEHVHVIVQRPPSVTHPTLAIDRTLTLNCLVLDDPRNVFTVKIPNTENVSILKDEIKKKKAPAFDHVPADTLVLWKVSILADDNLQQSVNALNLVEDSEQQLRRPAARLSNVFSDLSDEEHVHIIVQSPSSASDRILALNCLVLNEDARHVFPVEIGSAKTVGALKDEIKKKKAPAFDHVPADTLVLWKVSLPADSSLKQKLQSLELLDESSLQLPAATLSNVFPDLHVGYLHVIIRPVEKPAPTSTLDTIDELTEMLHFTRLEHAQDRLIKDALNAPSPSSAAILNAFIHEQQKRPIWNGRPSTKRGIPIQLYHPTFSKFMRAISDDTVDINLKPEDYSAAYSLLQKSAEVYVNEASRSNEIRVFLNKAIHHRITTLDVQGMKADGACQVLCGNLYALAAIEEEKNEIGTGGCDPTHQCGLDFRLYYAQETMAPIRNNSCCPTFLIALAGPWICILGAVFVENVIVQELTDFTWIGGHHYDDSKLKSVTRMLAAVGHGITKLEDFYSKLSSSNPMPDPQHFFPFIRQFPFEDRIVNFSYQAYLNGPSLKGHSKAIFLAKTEPEEDQKSDREIVVKFVQRYNPEAHRLLAAKRLAPELLYYSKEDADFPYLSGLIMVVMGYVNGKSAHERYGQTQLPQNIFDQVCEAVKILHAGNIVFGDLRPPNIMVAQDEQVMLVDFDWCGVHGEDTYPISLNDDQESPNKIDWHPDVKRGGKMLKEHDIFRLSTLQ